MDNFPAGIKKALSLYNAPPFPYNTKKDIAAVNEGTGKRKCSACGKCGKGRVHKKGRGRRRRHRRR